MLKRMSTRHLISYLVLGASIASTMLPAYAADARVANPASVEDVKQVFRLSGLDKVVLTYMRRNIEVENRAKPESALETDVYLSFATPDAIAEHLAPIYANYLSSDYAQKLIPALQTRIGKLSVRLTLIEAESGLDAAKLVFAKMPLEDRREINAFQASVTFKSLLNAEQNASKESRAMFREWSGEVVKSRARQVRKEIANLLESEMQKESESSFDTAAVSSNRLPRIGVRAFDQEASATFETLRRQARMRRQFARENSQLNLADVLKAENLVSREGLETGNLSILAAENVFSAHAKAYETLWAEYDKTILNIPMAPERRQELMANNDRESAVVFDIQVREAERMRTLLELEKQILAFCESHLGKIEYKDGKLIFQSDEDLTTYNTLIAQVRKEYEEIQNIGKEDLDRRKSDVTRLRG